MKSIILKEFSIGSQLSADIPSQLFSQKKRADNECVCIYIYIHTHTFMAVWCCCMTETNNYPPVKHKLKKKVVITIINHSIIKLQFSSVQFNSGSQSCQALCNPMDYSMLGFPVHHQLLSLLKPMSIESVIPSNYLILCHPLLLPSFFASIRVFSKESALHIRWPKYWSFSIIVPVNIQKWFPLGWSG